MKQMQLIQLDPNYTQDGLYLLDIVERELEKPSQKEEFLEALRETRRMVAEKKYANRRSRGLTRRESVVA